MRPHDKTSLHALVTDFAKDLSLSEKLRRVIQRSKEATAAKETAIRQLGHMADQLEHANASSDPQDRPARLLGRTLEALRSLRLYLTQTLAGGLMRGHEVTVDLSLLSLRSLRSARLAEMETDQAAEDAGAARRKASSKLATSKSLPAISQQSSASGAIQPTELKLEDASVAATQAPARATTRSLKKDSRVAETMPSSTWQPSAAQTQPRLPDLPLRIPGAPRAEAHALSGVRVRAGATGSGTAGHSGAAGSSAAPPQGRSSPSRVRVPLA